MLINSCGFQNPYSAKNQTSFKAQKASSVDDLRATVNNLKERCAAKPCNESLESRLKEAENALKQALKGK